MQIVMHQLKIYPDPLLMIEHYMEQEFVATTVPIAEFHSERRNLFHSQTQYNSHYLLLVYC